MVHMFCCCTYQNGSFCDFSVLFHLSLVSVVNLLPQKPAKSIQKKIPHYEPDEQCVIYIPIVKFVFIFLLTGGKNGL